MSDDTTMIVPAALVGAVREQIAAHRKQAEEERLRDEATARRVSRLVRGARTGIRMAQCSSTCPTCGLSLKLGMPVVFMDLWHHWRGGRLDGVAFCVDCAREQGCAVEIGAQE